MSFRDQIKNAVDFDLTEVDIPKWGKVYFRRWSTLATYKRIQDLHKTATDSDDDALNVMANVLVESLCDAQGNLELTQEDVEWIVLKNPAILTKAYTEIMRFNGLDLDSIKKNSEQVTSTSGDIERPNPIT